MTRTESSPAAGQVVAPRGPGVLSMEVVSVSGRARPVDFRILATTVEVCYIAEDSWHAVVFGRRELREWLKEPGFPLWAGALIFVVDNGRRIALIVPEADVWALPPRFLAMLRERT